MRPVANKSDLDRFIRFPWRIYKGDPNWVPPLLMFEREKFNPKHNAFYLHADVQLFLAHQGKRLVGRISAHIDHEHNRYHGETTGFFGFFESIDDPEVAGALLRTTEDWLRSLGMTSVRGPLNFSINGEVGFLVSGFNEPPLPLMTYTPEYYLRLVEQAGYTKAKDFFAWKWDSQEVPDGMPRRMVNELRARPDIKVRRARMKDFRAEVGMILEMYNDAWSENWGYVPMTKEEADALSKELKFIVDPTLVSLVEINGVPAAFGLAVPNYNWAMQPLNGHLLPFGWLRFLWRLKVRRPDSGRLLLLGIKKEFRSRKNAGLAYLICDEFRIAAVERGYTWAEFGWTLEDNGLINSLIKKILANHYKTYRVYEKSLA